VLIRKSGGDRLQHRLGPALGIYVIASFAVFAAICYFRLVSLHFIRFAPQWQTLALVPFLSIANSIFFLRLGRRSFISRTAAKYAVAV